MTLDRQLFARTLTDELREAWRALRAAHPGERFYSFGFYTAALAEYLMVTASSEEGLSRVTAEYVQRDGGDPELRRASLRWSPGDSPLHLEGEGLLPRSTALRDAGPDPYEDSPEADETVSLVYEEAVKGLVALDREGAFGTGEARSRIVLGIWCGDQSDEERVEFARALNPPEVVDRFARELEEGVKAFFALSDQA
jgi:hypothetical protein